MVIQNAFQNEYYRTGIKSKLKPKSGMDLWNPFKGYYSAENLGP